MKSTSEDLRKLLLYTVASDWNPKHKKQKKIDIGVAPPDYWISLISPWRLYPRIVYLKISTVGTWDAWMDSKLMSKKISRKEYRCKKDALSAGIAMAAGYQETTGAYSEVLDANFTDKSAEKITKKSRISPYEFISLKIKIYNLLSDFCKEHKVIFASNWKPPQTP